MTLAVAGPSTVFILKTDFSTSPRAEQREALLQVLVQKYGQQALN
jgi:hypothetical protein